MAAAKATGENPEDAAPAAKATEAQPDLLPSTAAAVGYPVIAKITLCGRAGSVAPGGLVMIETEEEARSLVDRGFASWPENGSDS